MAELQAGLEYGNGRLRPPNPGRTAPDGIARRRAFFPDATRKIPRELGRIITCRRIMLLALAGCAALSSTPS
jgi:hypothetical protein